MITRNKIWDEIKEADVFSRCAMRYASVQRKIQFAYKIAIPVLAALCALFSKLNMPNYTFWSAVLICLSTILKSFFTQIILSEKDIEKLDKLGVEFENFRTKYEDLMRKLDNNEISDYEASNIIDKQQSTYSKKKSELNKLILWIPSWINNRLQKESEEYLKGIHYNQY
jgi:hypothetical protein